MTNREKLKEIFPNIIKYGNILIDDTGKLQKNILFDDTWWNADYKEPTAEALVSLGVYKQVAWERDIAIQQLHELGYEFGQKIEPTTKNDLGVNTDKLISDCEKMSFDIEIFNKPLKVVALDAVKNIVNDLPSVTPQESKTGHWIDTNNHHYYNDGDIETTELRCSCCNEVVEWDIESLYKPYYCENCGCKNV